MLFEMIPSYIGYDIWNDPFIWIWYLRWSLIWIWYLRWSPHKDMICEMIYSYRYDIWDDVLIYKIWYLRWSPHIKYAIWDYPLICRIWYLKWSIHMDMIFEMVPHMDMIFEMILSYIYMIFEMISNMEMISEMIPL